MKCKVTFLVGGEEISFDLETDQNSSLIDLDIISALKTDDEKRKIICDLILNRLYRLSKITNIKYSDIVGKEGLLGNCTLESLKTEFTSIDFPDGVDVDILLINNLSIGGEKIKGRIINSLGKEVFVVGGNDEDLKRLAYFLKVRLLLQEQSFNFDKSSTYYETLQKILDRRNRRKDPVANIFELLLDYQQYKGNYQNIYIDGLNAAVYLENILNIILKYSGRASYLDQFVNTVNKLVIHRDDNRKYLGMTALYGAVKLYHPEILLKLGISSLGSFVNFFSKKTELIEDKLREVFGKVAIGSEGWNTLFTVLFEAEPEFTFLYDSMSNNGIYFKSAPKTIESKYGISYDTIHTFDILDEDYFGYKIYHYNDGENEWFIPSRGYLTEKAITSRYSSLDKVQEYIKNAILKLDIKKHSFIDFKFRNRAKEGDKYIYDDELSSFVLYSILNFTVGQIIESLDVPIVKTRIFNGEDILFTADRQNYSSFKKIVDSWEISDLVKGNILSKINNAEKIATFIYKVNELLLEVRSGEEAEKIMDLIVTTISTANKKTYYIASKSSISDDKYRYRIIPTNPIDIENYKKNKRTPILKLMLAIEEVMSLKFNVGVNMLTSEEISEKFPTIDVNTDKAFIRDGLIYINTTIADASDLLHEYVHLILGVLKTDPNLRKNYEQLMYLVNSKIDETKLKRLRARYSDISDMDFMEEMFAREFSFYIMNNINPSMQLIFEGNDKFLKDATKIIFNTEIDDLRSFYGKSIESIFKRFSSDVVSLLETKGLDFESTKISRYYSNWISKLILKGNIKETCYG